MSIRCIVRLLGVDRALLAWAEVQGEPRGHGIVGATGPFAAHADRTGVAVFLDVHWPDLDVHFRTTIAPVELTAGTPIAFQLERLFVINGSREPLPAVTVKQSVTISVPTGAMGVKGN